MSDVLGRRHRSELAAIASVVTARTGLSFPESRWAIAEAAIRRVQKQSGVRTTAAYLELLEERDDAFAQLVDELTIGETYFFRDPAQFEFLSREVLPAAASRGGRIRAWSAGCATGEEPFSIAILLDQLGHGGRGSVLGTDIAGARIARARSGLFGTWSLRGCPEPILREYFEKLPRGYALSPRIRNAVELGELNLADPEYPKRRPDLNGLDLVLCRNVLIYLDPDTIARVARRLLDSLNEDGWLLLGASDPPLQDLAPCHIEVTDAGLAYQRPRRRRRTTTGVAAAGRAAGTPPSTASDARGTGAAERAPLPSFARDGRRRSGYEIPQPLRRVEPGASGASPPREPGSTGAADGSASIAELRALLNERPTGEVESTFSAAARKHPTSAEIAYLHAALLNDLGRHSEAARAARDALYLDRRLAVAHLALSRALERTSDRRGAERALRNAETALAALPADAEVPAADGERTAALLDLVRARMRLLAPGGAR